MRLAIFDLNGNPIDQYTIVGDSADSKNLAREVDDAQIILSGYTQSYGAGGSDPLYMLLAISLSSREDSAELAEWPHYLRGCFSAL
ncbi:MAG: hypothetical protein AAGA89_04300 [Pseudomonadota bacterium]